MNLVYKARQCFVRALDSDEPAEKMREDWKTWLEYFNDRLRDLNFDFSQVEHELEETSKEAEQHSEYRHFCIDNFLALSEHALYCNCVGARSDDLSIPPRGHPISGEFVPLMELYLNRIKSEFALARYLFYQSTTASNTEVDTINSEVNFTELFEKEAIGLRGEMLRISFRLCFGILDKIAHGICDLFDLADKNENIYFERFWKPRGKNLTEKQSSRWTKINKLKNFPLFALYSQATDLNTSNGEWGIFKEWRNALEHEMVILTTKDTFSTKQYQFLEVDDTAVTIEYENFVQKTLHLLQLTCSAIFNYTFCVRIEGIKHLEKNGSRGKKITFYPKNFAG